jgi:hypothetical protein
LQAASAGSQPELETQTAIAEREGALERAESYLECRVRR